MSNHQIKTASLDDFRAIKVATETTTIKIYLRLNQEGLKLQKNKMILISISKFSKKSVEKPLSLQDRSTLISRLLK